MEIVDNKNFTLNLNHDVSGFECVYLRVRILTHFMYTRPPVVVIVALRSNGKIGARF